MTGANNDRERARVRLERAIVNRMLTDDHPRRWTRAEIERQLRPQQAPEVDEALEHLLEMGVISVEHDECWPSQCTSHLERIQVIGI